MRISRKFITVVAVGLAGLGTAPAHAEPETPYAPTMIILDASGSMRRPDPAGTMMDAARNAVRTFVDSAPATARVGLATYGTGTGNDEAEKAAGCRDVRILRQADSDGVTLTVSETWRGAAEEGRGTTDQCAGAGRYYFSVEWDNVSEGVPARLPLEILVGIEPAAIDPGPVAVLPATTFVPPTTAAQPVTGGGSFNSASAISNITTTLYSPLAEEIDSDSHVYTGSAGVLPAGDSAIATVPIRYNNRTADQADVREQSVAGWYYIAVKLGSAAADGQTPVPVHLDLTVAGTAESGPTYADDTGNGVLGEGKAPVTSAPTATGAEAESRRGGLVLAAVGGVGAAVILGGALLIVLRRRRG
ncbi:VWA domain-containing protein [Nocardia otitidiscaviarum]|uniref:vWA domain-containing protein n=1 Tax=Nocardia otitidiscaviarum TaxID=1823 RepID=UPI00069393E9|nr:VWA domain-containing protein [Nocardia otitidiscaviarum]MBF6135761.1 VWA domain-containing protein [Nocardia otitidiscaviarum]MBF6483574.1 VWA domain-containing protein [Nocardia otitidiscaviarum]